MTDEKLVIHCIKSILEDHKGRDNGIHLSELWRQLANIGLDISDRGMRIIIAREFTYVCSGAKGLYLAQNTEEKRAAIEYHRAYIRNHQKRATAIAAQSFPGERTESQMILEGL